MLKLSPAFSFQEVQRFLLDIVELTCFPQAVELELCCRKETEFMVKQSLFEELEGGEGTRELQNLF